MTLDPSNPRHTEHQLSDVHLYLDRFGVPRGTAPREWRLVCRVSYLVEQLGGPTHTPSQEAR